MIFPQNASSGDWISQYWPRPGGATRGAPWIWRLKVGTDCPGARYRHLDVEIVLCDPVVPIRDEGPPESTRQLAKKQTDN